MILRAVLTFFVTIVVFGHSLRVEAEPTRLYYFADPIPIETQIGMVGRVTYYIIEAAQIGAKAYLLHEAGGGMGATVPFVIYQVATSYPGLMGMSLLDLEIRRQFQWRSYMGRVEQRIPGLRKVVILFSKSLSFQGPLAVRQNNTGHMFIETTEDLSSNSEIINEFGRPIELQGSHQSTVEFQLFIGDKPEGLPWLLTLTDAFLGQQISLEIAESWRQAIDKENSGRGIIDRKLFPNNRISVHARLLLENDRSISAGMFMDSKAVGELLGMTWISQLKGRVPIIRNTQGRINLKVFNRCIEELQVIDE